MWDGKARRILVDEADTDPLVGMALLTGYELMMQVRARGKAMELDKQKIDDALLALLYLGLHDGARAWKGFDWDAMDRLHQEGYITNPRGKAKSVVFTEEGLERAQRLLEELFGKHA
jgi:hypothetical protein